MMTVNQQIQLFQNIATAHDMIEGFGFGDMFEINGNIKDGLKYNLLWVVPLESIITEQTVQRRYRFICLGLVQKDQSNRNEVWSDTEKILSDIIKIFRNENDGYDLLGEPNLTPVQEQHGDWVAGYECTMVIETEFASNYCDIPMRGFGSPVTQDGYGIIKNVETGEVIKTLKKGETYYITILDTIEQDLDTVTPTIIQILS
nr:hypothetical protein [uncultured Flavobacterium sp.]